MSDARTYESLGAPEELRGARNPSASEAPLRQVRGLRRRQLHRATRRRSPAVKPASVQGQVTVAPECRRRGASIISVTASVTTSDDHTPASGARGHRILFVGDVDQSATIGAPPDGATTARPGDPGADKPVHRSASLSTRLMPTRLPGAPNHDYSAGAMLFCQGRRSAAPQRSGEDVGGAAVIPRSRLRRGLFRRPVERREAPPH